MTKSIVCNHSIQDVRRTHYYLYSSSASNLSYKDGVGWQAFSYALNLFQHSFTWVGHICTCFCIPVCKQFRTRFTVVSDFRTFFHEIVCDLFTYYRIVFIRGVGADKCPNPSSSCHQLTWKKQIKKTDKKKQIKKQIKKSLIIFT